MKDVMGVIFTGENDARLRELTMTRAIAALPVAGRYRVIDFLVSSMVNGGLRNIGVIMQKNYHSLMDHLGSGKEWDLHGKNDGLRVLPPFLTRENVGVYNGILDALRSNTNYLTRSRQEYLVLSGSNIIYNCDIDKLVQYHISSGAEITLMYSRNQDLKRDEYGSYINVAEDGNVTEMEVEPTTPSLECCSMDVMVMKRQTLLALVERGVSHGLHSMNHDIIMPMIQNQPGKVKAFEYKGLCWRIDSVQSFFRFNMDVLDPAIRHSLFTSDLPVYTKVRDEMPSTYGDNAVSINSLVADGCIIDGTVENSILFRGVHVDKDSHVKNCIIMQDGHVYPGAYVENCILDKQAVIKSNARLIGPNAYPIVIAKNVVI